jgi:hypothetical protein
MAPDGQARGLAMEAAKGCAGMTTADPGELAALLDPYMWVHFADAEKRWPGDRLAPHGRLHVSGILKPPEHRAGPVPGAQADVNAMARTVREALYLQAEDGIEAAGKAGWDLLEHPQIEFRGTLAPVYDSAGGIIPRTVIQRAEGAITLWFRIPPA